MNGTILEVALNGPWSRSLQPGMPITTHELITEGIACAREGAAVIHIHVYDPDTGRQYEDFDAYRAVIEGIRAVEDVIVYPTLPLSGSADAPDRMMPSERFATMEALARAGLIEWAVVDPGSTQFSHYTQIEREETGFIYENTEEELIYGLEIATRHRVRPSYAIYEPGFARLGAAHAQRMPGLPVPVYRLMFSVGFTFGFPPRRAALQAYVDLLSETAPGAPWMIAGLDVDILPLIPDTLALNGHVRVGLEDAPFGTEQSNLNWTTQARRQIETSGGRVLTAPEVRAKLAPQHIEKQLL